MSKRALLTAACVALLGFAPAPFPRTQGRRAAEPIDLCGTWELLLWESAGRRARRTEELLVIRMSKDRFAFVEKKTDRADDYVMALDPAASPPAFSLRPGKVVEFVGSYRFVKGELTMIFSEGEQMQRRPTDFAGKPDYKIVLRRIRHY